MGGKPRTLVMPTSTQPLLRNRVKGGRDQPQPLITRFDMGPHTRQEGYASEGGESSLSAGAMGATRLGVVPSLTREVVQA